MHDREVILLDEGWDATMYVAAGLRRAGATVHIVTATHNNVLDTRYLGRGITRGIVPPVGSAGYLRAVEAALDARPRAAVLAMTEPVLYALWDTDASWIDRIFPRVAPAARERLRDKSRMSEHLAGLGVQIPAQRSSLSAACVEEAIECFGLPVVVKGAAGTGGATVRIAHTAQQALAAAVRISRQGSCFLQQYIAGPTYLVGGLFREGEPIRLYAAEKTECAHATGPSLRLCSVDDPALIVSALQVFRALRWTGLASVDLMRGQNRRDYFIEFNPRPWGSIAACTQAKVDLFGPLARLLFEQAPEADLSFAAGVNSSLFPQVACARLKAGGLGTLLRLAAEPRLWRDAPWRQPGLLLHLSRQLWWTWSNGTRERRDSRLPSGVPIPADRELLAWGDDGAAFTP